MAKPIGERLLEMLNGQIMTDVTFVVQGTEIKGHRIVVSSYGGPLRELLETKEERVKISEGVSLNTFKAVLQYLYTDECTIGNDNVFVLLHAAKTFQLQDLMNRCVKILMSNLTIENVAAHTAQALHYDVKEYLRICEDYFRNNTLEVLNTKGFLEVSNEVLLELVSTEGIGCSELELFTACLEWAENDCKRKKMEPTAVNRRICLRDVLNQIKFSKMSKDDFMSIVVPTDILTTEEVGNIIKDWQKKQKGQMPTRLHAKALEEKRKHETSDKMGASAQIKQVEHPSQEDYSGPNVDEIITLAPTSSLLSIASVSRQVTVQTYNFWGGGPEVITLSLPLSTRISQVKEMKIFKGHIQCPPDKFILEHKGKELADDTTLASIYSPGKDLYLKLHSLTLTIKERNGALEFPLTFTLEEYKSRRDEIIKEHVQRLKGIQPDSVEVDGNYWLYPGGTIVIYLE